MANVKSRLKAPKSAATKKKTKGENKIKKSSTSPKSLTIPKSLTSEKLLASAKLLTSPKSLKSAKALTSPQSLKSAKPLTSPKSLKSAKLLTSPKSLKSTKSLTSPKNLKSAKSLTSPKKVKSAKSSTNPKKLKSAKSSTNPKKLNSAKSLTTSKLLKIPKSLTSPKSLAIAKSLISSKLLTSAKSSKDPKNLLSKKNDTVCEVVMRRPCQRRVMTPDQKIKFLLKNGHKLKAKFIAKPCVNVKQTPKANVELHVVPTVEPTVEPNVEPKECLGVKEDSNLPLMTKSGRLKKKKQCDMTVVDDILKNELMISSRRNTKNADDALSTEAPSMVVEVPPLRVGVDNNNDMDITNQNNALEESSDDGSDCKVSDVESEKSEDLSEDKSCSKNKKKAGPTHITLRNGVMLKLAYYECDHCNRTFNRKCSLRRHMYIHLGLKPFQCLRCPQEFRSLYNLQVHVSCYHRSSTNDPELFICNFCEKPFLVKENLRKHLDTHMNNDSSFKCIYCNKVFAYHILLMQHEKKHMVKGRHQCTLCSMSYRCRNLLYLHVKSHLKIKDFICQFCGKEFLRPNSLKRHVEVSHGEHRIVCPVCKKKLKGHLTEHMRTHEKKRPHVCPECGQRFTQSTQLNVHRRSHTGDRPYPCRICKRFFSHSNALMLHIRRHTGEKPFPCAMCPMSFSQLPHMKTHMRKIHGKENPYKCAHCDSFYKLKAELDVHEKTCTAGTAVNEAAKGKKNRSKKGEEDIEVESAMSLSRMRFLLALLLTMIATKEKLKYLGFNKRLVDEILIESLEAMGKTPCNDNTLPPANRLRKNIEMFIIGTVPKNQMANFKKENKSIEDILELLTTEKDK